jgi:catechol 2,3-dioxygenase-like lactoylglutathione lyase family enzyme
MPSPWMYNHVDVRVRDVTEAIAFYDAWLPLLGIAREHNGEWTSYERNDGMLQWFAFTEDARVSPSLNRISFAAETHDDVDRVAAAAKAAGAVNYEAPSIAFAKSYSAYFEDPSGNRLEICCAAF